MFSIASKILSILDFIKNKQQFKLYFRWRKGGIMGKFKKTKKGYKKKNIFESIKAKYSGCPLATLKRFIEILFNLLLFFSLVVVFSRYITIFFQVHVGMGNLYRSFYIYFSDKYSTHVLYGIVV